jgi:hypothetical protein
LNTASRDSVSADTTGLLSKKKNIAKADTLVPLQQQPLYSGSYCISNSTINHFDYRYSGNILEKFPFDFLRDKGFIGQQSETFLYGAGNTGISFLQDGILFNNPYTNSLDLNNIQSEFVDSIEILPSPRGFLFGLTPNPVTVNFISKDYLSVTPYSKIKYYQGPGEAFVDALFSALLIKDFNILVDITNRSIDSTYANSDFSIWHAKVRLKYFLSNSFNFEGTYGYVKSEKGLNGGINADSIANSGEDINSQLYNENFAPVNFLNRDQEFIEHFFNLRLLSNLKGKLKGSTDFYFRFNQDKVSNIDSSLLNINNKNKIYGINFRQLFSSPLLNIDFIGNYEHIDFNSGLLERNKYSVNKNSSDNLSLAAIMSFKLLNESLTPSFYYKYFNGKGFNLDNKSLGGFGADLTYRLNGNLNFYAGYSNYKIEKSGKNINDLEASINYSAQNIFLSLVLFSRNLIIGTALPDVYYYDHKNLTGSGLKVNYLFEKVLLEAAGEYYLNAKNDLKNLMPDLNFMSGIYYKDILFHSNLNLKTGFLFYYTGKQNLPAVYSQEVLNYFNYEIPFSLRVDYTLAGEIQKVAIVYFTWENLFNKQYFITPFYPMPSRSIRFGVSWELFN